MTGRNWAGNVVFGARSHARPTSIDHLQAVVAGSDRVRALGSGHSFNRIADTDGTQVTVAGLPRDIEIDTSGRRVRDRYAWFGQQERQSGDSGLGDRDGDRPGRPR